MKQFNDNLLRHYFTEPSKLKLAENGSSDIRANELSDVDPAIEEIKEKLIQFKHELKLFSLELLQKTSKAKYQLETIRGLGIKVLLIENHITERSYLSSRSKMELSNRLNNYIFTFKVLKGERHN